MTKFALAPKRDSVIVTVLCGLGIAVSFIALASHVIPFIGDRVALLVSLLGLLIAMLCLAIALVANTRLVLPVVAVLVAAAPAAAHNVHEMRTVWVESYQLCRPPGLRSMSLVGLLANTAMAADHRNAVGGQVCAKLGKRYTDYDCDQRVGRIKCEP